MVKQCRLENYLQLSAQTQNLNRKCVFVEWGLISRPFLVNCIIFFLRWCIIRATRFLSRVRANIHPIQFSFRCTIVWKILAEKASILNFRMANKMWQNSCAKSWCCFTVHLWRAAAHTLIKSLMLLSYTPKSTLSKSDEAYYSVTLFKKKYFYQTTFILLLLAPRQQNGRKFPLFHFFPSLFFSRSLSKRIKKCNCLHLL